MQMHKNMFVGNVAKKGPAAARQQPGSYVGAEFRERRFFGRGTRASFSSVVLEPRSRTSFSSLVLAPALCSFSDRGLLAPVYLFVRLCFASAKTIKNAKLLCT